MISAERIKENNEVRTVATVKGDSATILAELTSLCRVVHSGCMPDVPIDLFMKLLAVAVKEFKADETKVEDLSEENEAEAVDCTGRMN